MYCVDYVLHDEVANIYYVHYNSRLPIIDHDLLPLCQGETQLSQQAIVQIFKHHLVHAPLLNEEDHLMHHQHPFTVIPIGRLRMILGQPLQEDENDHHLNLLVTEHVNKFA